MGSTVAAGVTLFVSVGTGKAVALGGSGVCDAVDVWVALGVNVDEGSGVIVYVWVWVAVGVKKGVNVTDGVHVSVVEGVILGVRVL